TCLLLHIPISYLHAATSPLVLHIIVTTSCSPLSSFLYPFFFFNNTATTEIYTLSLHDALPICRVPGMHGTPYAKPQAARSCDVLDRKSTRLNSSHGSISYAVFCLKKKKKKKQNN